MQTLGQRLYQLRQDKGLARTALAMKIGVSKTAIKNWEDNDNIPKTEYLKLLADYFHCDINYLLRGESKENLSKQAKEQRTPVLSKSDVLSIDTDSKQLYWLIIDDDSMSPTFDLQHLVLIDPALLPQPGDYVVGINDDQVLFRKWRDCGIDDTRGQNYSQLVALNLDYPTLDSRFTEFVVCGVATEHRIKLK